MLTQRQPSSTVSTDRAQLKLQASSYSKFSDSKQEEAVIVPTSTDSKCDSGDELEQKEMLKQQQKLQKQPTLSVRAEQARQQLTSGATVDAVVLNRSGGTSQIRYNTKPSLKQANTILNGRPTIVGEFEEIGVIIVRAMHTGCCCKFGRNAHRLPAPFQNEQFCGDYLLFRVDADGSPQDFSAKEFQQFELEMRSKTEEALLNQQEESSEPSQQTETSLAESVRQQIDLRVRQEFVSKFGRVPNEQEAQQSVDATLQILVQTMVSSKARDADYDPVADERQQKESIESESQARQSDLRQQLSSIQEEEEQAAATAEQELIELWQQENDTSMTPQEFRQELDSALSNVRRLARVDGQKLAARLAETFFELNGREPEVNEITNIFRRIKASLEMEAQEDVDEDADDDGTANYFNQKYDDSFNDASSQDLVEYAKRIVTEDLISRSRRKLFMESGQTPNSYELRLEMLDMFQAVVDGGEESMAVTNDSEEIRQRLDQETDPDYNPDNEADQQLKRRDEEENAQFEDSLDQEQDQDQDQEPEQKQDWTPVKMLSTPAKQKANAIQYDIYFENEENISAKLNLSNTEKARERFSRMHKREPNKVEIENMKLFVSASVGALTEVEYELVPERSQEERAAVQDQKADENEDESKQDEEQANSGSVEPKQIQVLTTPVKSKTNSARYDVFFNNGVQKESTNEKALEWFRRMCKRNPTETEAQNIAQFLRADKSELTSTIVNVQSTRNAN